MKKLDKIKLRLNTQTIRRLQVSNLPEIQGGRPLNNSDDVCISVYPCGRGCG